ncbi:MAG TPA: class I SAM-dependent methyltransferase [Acidimicrobiia bacterium]|nr:class I SAM-dependent methyltransferase [Acidimicrobiia bacterium]
MKTSWYDSRGVDKNDPAYRGQTFYREWFLRIYDPVVLGFFAHKVWRCPTEIATAQYRRHIGARHLDIGPGTGYFLERAGLKPDSEVTLLDPNRTVLDYAARRLAPRAVFTVEADVMKPLPIEGPFDSVALNYVLHCLPGPIANKAVAVANAAATLTPGGILFGGTVLGSPDLHTRLSRFFLRAYNRQGAFDNLGDTEKDLTEILEASFESVATQVHGSVALFVAAVPRRLK